MAVIDYSLSDQMGELANDLRRRGDAEGAALCHAAAGAMLTLDESAVQSRRKHRCLVFALEVSTIVVLVTGAVFLMGWLA